MLSPDDVQVLELEYIGMTAEVDADGALHPLGKLWPKLLAAAVGGLGSAAATLPILTGLTELLRNTHANVRWAAARAVRQMMAQGIRIFRGRRGKVEGKEMKELAKL